MSGDSAEDRAIKRSAMDAPKFEARPIVPRLEGSEKAAMVANVVNSMNVDQTYTNVNVYNYPAFDEAWDHMLINFYYTNAKDPLTSIKSYRVYTAGEITNA